MDATPQAGVTGVCVGDLCPARGLSQATLFRPPWPCLMPTDPLSCGFPTLQGPPFSPWEAGRMASGLGGAPLLHASAKPLPPGSPSRSPFPWALSVQALVINQLNPRMMAALTPPPSPQHQEKPSRSKCGTRQTWGSPCTCLGLDMASPSSVAALPQGWYHIPPWPLKLQIPAPFPLEA